LTIVSIKNNVKLLENEHVHVFSFFNFQSCRHTTTVCSIEMLTLKRVLFYFAVKDGKRHEGRARLESRPQAECKTTNNLRKEMTWKLGEIGSNVIVEVLDSLEANDVVGFITWQLQTSVQKLDNLCTYIIFYTTHFYLKQAFSSLRGSQTSRSQEDIRN
jgi:hypothetical protein